MKINWRNLLYYIDIIIATILCMLFFNIVFFLPTEFFVSPLYAMYNKLFGAILLGLTISFVIFLSIFFIYQVEKKAPISSEVRKQIEKEKKPRVAPIKKSFAVSFITKHKRLQSLAKKISMSLAPDVLEAGESISNCAARRYFSAFC